MEKLLEIKEKVIRFCGEYELNLLLHWHYFVW